MKAEDIITYMVSLADENQRVNLMRFFKTGKGQYGEGDSFLGIKVPITRSIVKHSAHLPLDEIPTLLHSKWHEVRLCGFLLLVSYFEKYAKKKLINDATAIIVRDKIVDLYLQNAKYANNWDLVDLSVYKILGHWLMLPSAYSEQDKIAILDDLATSGNLWLERMSIVSSSYPTSQGEPFYCLRYAEKHLNHSHDLMHKAVGWMLREMGQKVSMDLLCQFLEKHVHEMSRTTLRYAIEKMSESDRQYYMQL